MTIRNVMELENIVRFKRETPLDVLRNAIAADADLQDMEMFLADLMRGFGLVRTIRFMRAAFGLGIAEARDILRSNPQLEYAEEHRRRIARIEEIAREVIEHADRLETKASPATLGKLLADNLITEDEEYDF